MQRLVQAGCAVAFVALAAGAVVATPALAQAPAPGARTDRATAMAQRHTILEAEIVGFKASLALTPAQEALWPAFAAALEPPTPSTTTAPAKHDATRSPITQMQRASDRLEHRAQRLSAIAKAAAPLYATLNDQQKLIFRVMLARTAFAHPLQWGHDGHHHWRG